MYTKSRALQKVAIDDMAPLVGSKDCQDPPLDRVMLVLISISMSDA
jgi:hypothetical protein